MVTEKKYHLKAAFCKEQRKGFVVTCTLDKICSRDQVSTELEKFTIGYHDNFDWFGLTVHLTEVVRVD